MNRQYTITELAREFDVTPRAIRFYEDQGLLAPSRDRFRTSFAGGDQSLVGRDAHLARAAEVLDRHCSDRAAEIARDDAPVGRDCDVFEHGFAPMTEFGWVDSSDLDFSVVAPRKQSHDRGRPQILGADGSTASLKSSRHMVRRCSSAIASAPSNSSVD